MQTPIEVISGFGSPTNSYLAAIQFFREERNTLSKEEYEDAIAKIIGADTAPSFRNEKESALHFLYVVQETVRAFNSGVIPDMAEIWELAQNRVKYMIECSPWAIKEYTSAETSNINVPNAAPKRKKGAKKDLADTLYRKMNDGKNDRIAIIAALIDEVGMSKAGATTYFHNLRKKYGFAGPVTKKKRGRKTASVVPTSVSKPNQKKVGGLTKGQIATAIYAEMKDKPKSEVVARIVAETGTTPAGANTYYCAARKQVGE
jgi:hypothetical protein